MDNTTLLIEERIRFYERQAQQAQGAAGALRELLKAMLAEAEQAEEVIHDGGTNDDSQ